MWRVEIHLASLKDWEHTEIFFAEKPTKADVLSSMADAWYQPEIAARDLVAKVGLPKGRLSELETDDKCAIIVEQVKVFDNRKKAERIK